MNLLFYIALIGLILTLYSIYVKKKLEKVKNYRPICDINENISCTKAFKSKYYSILLIPNTYYGLAYYLSVMLLSFNNQNLIFYFSVPALIFSIYLAYITYFKLKNFCLVCSGVYIINFLIPLVSLYY